MTVIRRNLLYPPQYPAIPATEKGIDVAIAVDMIRLAMSADMDAAILFSCDKDLLPAIEMIWDYPSCHIEVAAWSGAPRLRIHGTQLPWCHTPVAAGDPAGWLQRRPLHTTEPRRIRAAGGPPGTHLRANRKRGWRFGRPTGHKS
ncbi:NYN domain-containing protein [Mycobacterium heckeshornense]|uniref:NYN domain-containing protein n=1 Tax=Mycobacterium heckeshornense TaxID=110505 RepID=UPI000B0A2040|nr:NYN domain-containing protein [Mycobacterium heckeshornense]